MSEREPKDYHLARRAYEAFYDEQPQVWFESLSHDYQMKWVRVVRAVVNDAKKYAKAAQSGTPLTADKIQGYRDLVRVAPRRGGGQVDWSRVAASQQAELRRALRYIWELDKKLTKK